MKPRCGDDLVMHARSGRGAPSVAGMILAAGAGTRMGMPKALVGAPSDTEVSEDSGLSRLPRDLSRLPREPSWLRRAVALHRRCGCDPIVVVLGAGAQRALKLLQFPTSDPEPAPAIVPVIAADWRDGQSASLRAGLEWLAHHTDADHTSAVLITLVDLPQLTSEALSRVLASASQSESQPHLGCTPEPAAESASASETAHRTTRSALARAMYAGRPGHPVLIGRAHWAGVIDTARGDTGARDYLRSHGTVHVECGDLGGGDDRDTPV